MSQLGYVLSDRVDPIVGQMYGCDTTQAVDRFQSKCRQKVSIETTVGFTIDFDRRLNLRTNCLQTTVTQIEDRLRI